MAARREWDLNGFVSGEQFSEAMSATDQEVELYDRVRGYYTRGTLHFTLISGKSFRGTLRHGVERFVVIGRMETDSRGTVMEE